MKFSLLPMRQSLELTPGETFEGSFLVVNPADSDTDLKFKVEITPFSVSGEDYRADFAAESDRTLITNWLSLSETSGTLKPNETKRIYFTISVPESAPAGGQYAAFAVSEVSDSAPKNVSQISDVLELISLVYADIAGETKHEGKVLENSVPGFSTSVPLFSKVAVENSGNVHETVSTSISVKNLLTGEIIYPAEGGKDENLDLILPETSRVIERELGMFSNLGYYEVTQSVDYLGETSVFSGRVLVCPLWFLGLTTITVALLIYTIILIFRRRRH